MNKPFILFEDVAKIYQMGEVEIKAVDGADFTIEKGEFTVIVGPSGAGKTTILNMLGGMDNCSRGRIIVDGRDVSKSTPRQLTEYRRYDIEQFPLSAFRRRTAASRDRESACQKSQAPSVRRTDRSA